ncbi:MAG: BACON domain-containing carbohydrate-binding protein [Vicinamibacterales bacterium]
MDTPRLTGGWRLVRRAAALAWLTAGLAPACGQSSTTLLTPSNGKCTVSAAASLDTAPASGTSGTLTVTTTRDCVWAASSSADWVTLTGRSSGQGPGSAEFRVAANPETATREARIAVNDTEVRLVQMAACRFSVEPAGLQVDSGGGTRTLVVSAGPGCTWTTASLADWIVVSQGGTASQDVTVTIAPNHGAPRRGSVVVADRTVEVAQGGVAAPPCVYTVEPTGQSVGNTGGRTEVRVTTGPTCAWTARALVPWIRVASGTSGTGPGAVALDVEAGGVSPRSGTVQIAGVTVTVTQAPAECTTTLSSTLESLPAAGGEGSVEVTTGAPCAWTASSDAPDWLSISGASVGTGSGRVRFAAAANPGPPRTGHLGIGGQTLTVVQQGAPCLIMLRPVALDMAAAGGTAAVDVAARADCGWSASTTTPWITLSGMVSGTGNGQVTVAAAPNEAGLRTSVLTIGGVPLTITQAAAPCLVTLEPSSLAVPASDGAQSVTVTTGSWCTWSARAQEAWIQIGAPTGTGPGHIPLTVLPTDAKQSRTGTMVVGTATVSVVQAGLE